MTYNTYFTPTPATVEELKKMYRKLAFENHPDRGGDAEIMKQINNEYDTLFARLKDVHTAADGTQYTSTEKTAETAKDFREIIERLIHIPQIDIELCGRWLWISGNTYAAREELKAAGCRYASRKKMWYWHFEEDGTDRPHKPCTMERIRELYGSEEIAHTAARVQLTATT